MDYPLRKRYSPKLPNIETIKTPIRVKSEKILPQASLSSFKNNTDRPSTQSKTHKYTLSYENTERHLGKTPSILLPTRVESLNIFSKHVKVSEPLIKSSSFNSPYLKTKLEIVMTLRELIHTHDSDLTITRLKTILKALEILANEEGKYQGEMLFMVDEIKKTLYIHKEKIDPKILEIVYERHIDALTDQDGYIPYIYLYYIILEINQKLNQNESNLKNDNENSKVKYEQEIDALKLKISELQGTANGKTEGTLNWQEECNKLHEEIERKDREIKLKNARFQEVETKLKNSKKVLKDAEYMNLDLKEEVKKTNEIVINLREQIRQSNVEHERLKEKHASISGGYATIIYKLKRSYDSHDELEKQNSQLLHEKSELSVRAAAGYENLTPRPNLGLLFKELDVVVPEISTSDKVEVLLSELKEFKNKMNRRKLTKRAVLKSPRRSSPNAEVDDSKLSKDRSRDGSFIELAVPTPKNASDRSLHWSTLLKP